MSKLVIYVNELVRHKVTLDLPEEDIHEVLEELDGLNGSDFAGDLCDRSTIQDGEWELDYYDLQEVNNV